MWLHHFPQNLYHRFLQTDLRTVLVLPFVFQLFSVVGLVGYLSYRNGRQSVHQLAIQLETKLSDLLQEKVQAYLGKPHDFHQITLSGIRSGTLDPNDFSALERYFWRQIRDHGLISYAYFGNPQGDLISVKRDDQGRLITRVRDSSTGGERKEYALDAVGNRTELIKSRPYDARLRPWYQAAIAAKQPTWSPIHASFSDNLLEVNAVIPVYDDVGAFQGVLGTELNLRQIGDFLRSLSISASGQAFIIEHSGEVVAASTSESPFVMVETLESETKGYGEGEGDREKEEETPENEWEAAAEKPVAKARLSATQSQNQLTLATATYLLERFDSFDQIQNTHNLTFKLDGELQLVRVTPLQDGWGLDWLLVVAIPESDFMGEIYANTRLTVLLCVGALVLAVVMGGLATRRITRPIQRLNHAAKEMAAGNLEQQVKVSQPTEIKELGNSFNHMAAQLKHSFQELETLNGALVHGSLHDALTGLPNRTLLMERLEIALKRFHRDKDYQFAVLFLDLDRFKRVNDSLGHYIGDQFLLKIADLLRLSLRDVDMVARLGGDEFVILLDEICEINEVILVVQRIQTHLSQPFQLEEHTVASSASIGIVLGNPNYCSVEDLLRDADVAMYRAKEAGRTCYEIFDHQMHLEALQLLQLESDLRQALLQDEFILYYQPIISLSTGKLVGFEALIRWRHPSGKLVYPKEFLPIAEENGLILEIGDWVLQAVLSQLKTWEKKKEKDISGLEISINLSGKQLYSNRLIQKIDQITSEIEIDAHRLRFELTESILIENTDDVKNVLESIKERNIQLSIDDFGTGFSCMSYLHQFPIDCLKLDKSFVENMDSDKDSTAIVKGIISLAKNLNMGVVAEGVEDRSQLTLLQEIGCDCAQGYFFSSALTPESAQKWLAAFSEQTQSFGR